MVLAGLRSAVVLLEPLRYIQRTFPQIQAVRWWRERPVYNRRAGFKIAHHITGPLPRIPVTADLRPLPGEKYRPINFWSHRKATQGQNDYIDILGDGTLHPRDLLTAGPHYLRGFKGTEFRRLIRRRNATFHYAPYVWPTKWNNVKKRINYLFTYHNHKQNHKDWRNHE